MINKPPKYPYGSFPVRDEAAIDEAIKQSRTTKNVQNTTSPPIATQSVKDFAGKISRYFLDFLQTDFKVQKAPRRRILLKTESGFRAGVPLRKYESLCRSVWDVLAKPVNGKLTLRLPRGRYKAPISHVLRDLLRKHVDGIDPESFEKVRRATLAAIKDKRAAANNDPEAYVEAIRTEFAEDVNLSVVAPLLALLEGHFEAQAYSAMESVFEAQTDLIAALAAPVSEQLPSALNTFIARSDLKEAEEVLERFFSEEEAKSRLKEFFEDLAAADAYQELRDVAHFARMGGQNLQIYLYICDLKFGNTAYPVFYIPVTVNLDDKSGDMLVTLDPHLYVHKNAIDFVQQELRGAANLALSPIDNRILYLAENQSFLSEMQRILVKMSTVFDLVGELDVSKPGIEMQQSAAVKLTKSAYFAAFDRADESLLNDYEALLTALKEDEQAVTELFHDMVRAILMDDPIDIRKEVENKWADFPIADRLVVDAPIPLNEEQRQVLMAKDDPRCRFITLQGPPGTGKSHTITAIAFDCIQKGQSCLVLSDKTEALDVVEDKLSQVLSAIRGDDDFPNPILRLGKVGGTFARLISQATQEKIRTHYAATRSSAATIDRDTNEAVSSLRQGIEKTVQAYTSITVKDMTELLQLEDRLQSNPRLLELLRDTSNAGRPVEKCLNGLEMNPGWQDSLGVIITETSFSTLLELALAYQIAEANKELRVYRESLGLFETVSPDKLDALRKLIVVYETARMPIFGYLFSRRKVMEINARVAEAFKCTRPYDLHLHVDGLKQVVKVVEAIRQAPLDAETLARVGGEAYRILASSSPLHAGACAVADMLKEFHAILLPHSELRDALAIGPGKFRDARALLEFLRDALRYMQLHFLVHHVMGKPPELDYVGTKTKLERLYTVRMTHELDRRFISFVDNNKATAKTLGGVIRQKQRFPEDKFSLLKDTFPVIIAGIREFAEYVPLKKDVFDVVVIDEASQVSVAQALPAILRARKVIVLGDRKQFSNVKSMQASIAQNSGYLTDLEDFFRKKVSTATDSLQRLKAFDVKKSILEFFELCSNYRAMLRKHFRGYQELISFSSKTFYEDQLQAIKVRGKPIEDVIRFTVLEPATAAEAHRNVNSAEADFIRDRLREMAANESPPTVGIITPFREQQQYLTKLLMHDIDAAAFEEKLRLKIMTFDTCQGEERDYILYSMVATPTQDLLNYIFPVGLDNTSERVEEQLKMQRLNVGFSRARECVHFVLSKPVTAFGGSIGRVLSHYHQVLNDRTLPEGMDTDPASPMEKKLLDWIKKTPFFLKNRKRIDLQAQFKVGEYLRQLDPTYHHPAWRADFLLVYREDGSDTKIIIEYDGFAEHFTNHDIVHEGNYESFYRPQDIERQLVIESYGYKFLRVNRFNLGQDPVDTLSGRLAALAGAPAGGRPSEGLRRVIERVQSVEEGEGRICTKCNTIRPADEFFDKRLKGGVGRVCASCKRLR